MPLECCSRYLLHLCKVAPVQHVVVEHLYKSPLRSRLESRKPRKARNIAVDEFALRKDDAA
jgi:hypothetical protein